MEKAKRAAGLKESAIGRKDVFIVPVERLSEEAGFNARLDYQGIEEFADFIRENGALALPPLMVYRKGENIFISDGHRRIRAVRKVMEEGIEVKGVPCMNDPLNEEERTLAMVTRNSGAPLTKLETGLVFQRMLNFGWQQIDIAKRAGKSPAYVNQCIALASAPKKVQDLLKDGVVNDSTVLTMLGNVEEPSQIYDIIIQSVEEVKGKAAENAAGNGSGDTGNDAPAVNPRDVARAVRQKIGKPTVSTRMKALTDWIEAESLLLKDDPKYLAIKRVYDYLKGDIENIDDIIK